MPFCIYFGIESFAPMFYHLSITKIIEDCRGDSTGLWRQIDTLLGKVQRNDIDMPRVESLAKYFNEKVSNIRDMTSQSPLPVIAPRDCPVLERFEIVTADEVLKLYHPVLQNIVNSILYRPGWSNNQKIFWLLLSPGCAMHLCPQVKCRFHTNMQWSDLD